MDTAKIYTFDEHFVAFFKDHLTKRKIPNSPIELSSKLSIVCALAVSILLLSFLIIILKYNFESLNWKLNELSELGAGSVGCLIVCYREWTFIIKKRKINDQLNKLESIFPLKYEEQKNYNLDIHSKSIIKQNSTIRALVSNGCMLMVLIPICESIYYWTTSDDEYQFLYPFVTWNPFGNSSFFGYAVIYCIQAATAYCGNYIYCKDEVIIATSVGQMNMHYLHLGEAISKLDARNEQESNRKLVKLIRFQYKLNSICNDINKIHSFNNFVAFICVRIYACTWLISLINSNDIMKIPTFAFNLFVITLSVYLRCSVGTKLFEASSSILFSIYDHNWYEGTPKYRKTILLMMMRANKPMELKAFKIKTVSMEYFKELIVSTYEIFMFLYNFTK